MDIFPLRRTIKQNNPFSGLLNVCSTSNVKDLREKVENFKSYVHKTKISHHVVNDLLSFCAWMDDRSDLDLDIEEECIVPIITFFLEDANQEVSKTAYSHLAILINRGKISNQFIENHFCRFLAKVINDTFDDDFRLQAINTIFELIYYIDKHVIVREIMPEITKLCLNPTTDPTLKTACVSRLNKLASKLERDLTEKTIIPLYEKMANDKYKIRKNCVEVSVALSYICSKEVREKVLVPIYLSFLKDPIGHVSDLALIALGPFISSFANSEESEHCKAFNEVLVNNIYNFNYSSINFSLTNTDYKDYDYEIGTMDDLGFDEPKKFNTWNRYNKEPSKEFKNISLYDDEQDDDEVEVKDEFNSFNYWREPIMDISELFNNEISDEDKKSTNCNSEWLKDVSRKLKEMNLKYPTSINKKFHDSVSFFKNDQDEDMQDRNHDFNDADSFFELNKENMLDKNIEESLSLLKNSVVPNELLFFFLKNLLSNYGSNVYQADINCICAFSLPAVAFTIGKENWPCLRFAFKQLVGGLSTNVKLILASSLHELAKIIDPIHINRDILPALFDLMHNNDEVKERILKNLSSLVSSLEKNDQKTILRKLPQFYKLDNNYNWRFRVEFIKQFISLVTLYEKPKQFSQLIIPMIFSLLEDPVAEVRKNTIPLLTITIQHLHDSSKKLFSTNKLKETILDQIYFKLYLSRKWTFRQLFILVCDNLVLNSAVPFKTFKEKLFSPLLSLCEDKVNNVRLTLARILSNFQFQTYFYEDENTKNELLKTIELLSNDKDKDVRSFFIVTKEEPVDAEIINPFTDDRTSNRSYRLNRSDSIEPNNSKFENVCKEEINQLFNEFCVLRFRDEEIKEDAIKNEAIKDEAIKDESNKNEAIKDESI